MPHVATQSRGSRVRRADTRTSMRLASLRIKRGVHGSCAHCAQTIADADLACAVTLEGFDPARTMTFHEGCYRSWTRSQESTSAWHSTDAELAEGLQG
jgi:hypothetical protein